MADEKLLHAEDVIFNKPSLKELIRLIKNGTINAIWPSTKEEFDDWNNEDNPEGYKKYVDESIGRTADRLKLKSLNTSMTIYYGDHQDSTATGDIDIDKTQEKYNQVINAIDSQKQEIVNLNYYDSINDVYPINNENLILSLNTEDGQINNVQNVIDYKNIILEEYRKNIEKVNDFINRINNFKPNIETTSLTLSDEDLINDYNEFFINSTNEINENFRNIYISEKTDSNSDVQDCLIDNETSVYDFSKINLLYNSKEDNVNNILKYIEEYYKNTEQALSFNNSFITELKLISTTYQLYKNELQNKINEYYNNFENISNINFDIIKRLTMPYIYSYNFSSEEKILYEQDINNLYEKFIYPYETFVEYLFMLKYPHNNFTQAETFYQNILNTMKDNVLQYSTLEQKITYINQNYINQINIMATNTILLEKPIVEIKYLYDGTIFDKENIINNLHTYYNILYYQKKIFEDYQELFTDTQKTTFIINDISNFPTEYTQIETKINSILDTLRQDQERVIILYDNLQNEYLNFLNQIKNITIISIASLDFILEQNGIINIDEIKNSIQNQKNKLLNHYKVLTNALNYNMEESINNLNTESQNILTRINNTTIVSTDSGNEQDFIDQVIDPDKATIEDDYTVSAINLLLKRITNNELSFSEQQIIPKISEDFLTIYNKDTVINNLYAILNKGESLNREYTLSSKIDNINSLLESWRPFYNSQVYSHYTCIAVGSDIKFPNNKTNENKTAMSGELIDGTTTVLLDDQFYHYPQINNLADTITTNTRNTQVLTVGGLASLFGGSGNLTDRNVGNTYIPMYISKGAFTPCAGVVSGNYITTQKGGITYWDIVKYNGSSAVQVGLQAKKLFGAVYNDYAEYRSAEANPGRCIIENGDGTLSLSSGRLQLGANIVSDTYGFAIGETNEATCPVAVCGRVLVYPLESKEFYHPGAAVCSGPEGTVSLMTREEIREWPDAIIGYVSEVPTYDTWGSDNIPVNGRIWIKIK